MTADLDKPTKRGVRVTCAVCNHMKQPIGRDGGPVHYCDWECPGYRQPPHVGSLWPGETGVDFGFPCSDVGTEPVQQTNSTPDGGEGSG